MRTFCPGLTGRERRAKPVRPARGNRSLHAVRAGRLDPITAAPTLSSGARRRRVDSNEDDAPNGGGLVRPGTRRLQPAGDGGRAYLGQTGTDLYQRSEEHTSELQSLT